MDIAVPVALILMTCSPDSARCSEIQSDEVFATRGQCQAALPYMIQRYGASLGRCVHLGVDPVTTSDIAPLRSERLVTVTVTRMVDGEPLSEVYRVPAK